MVRARLRLAFATIAGSCALGLALLAASSVGGPIPGPLPVFPPTNWQNLDISRAPVDPQSAACITTP